MGMAFLWTCGSTLKGTGLWSGDGSNVHQDSEGIDLNVAQPLSQAFGTGVDSGHVE